MKLLIILMMLLSFSIFAEEIVCTTKHSANVRIEADGKSEVVKKLKRYTPLKVLERQEKWTHVQGYNFSGWIYNSLITSEYKCMVILKPKYSICGQKRFKRRKNPLRYLEGFKILKLEIGCNYVKDAWGQEFWLSNLNSWPVDGASLKIEIK